MCRSLAAAEPFCTDQKDQGEEGKRICSFRETSLVPVPACHFSVLPPVNKTGTGGMAPEVL